MERIVLVFMFMFRVQIFWTYWFQCLDGMYSALFS